VYSYVPWLTLRRFLVLLTESGADEAWCSSGLASWPLLSMAGAQRGRSAVTQGGAAPIGSGGYARDRGFAGHLRPCPSSFSLRSVGGSLQDAALVQARTNTSGNLRRR